MKKLRLRQLLQSHPMTKKQKQLIIMLRWGTIKVRNIIVVYLWYKKNQAQEQKVLRLRSQINLRKQKKNGIQRCCIKSSFKIFLSFLLLVQVIEIMCYFKITDVKKLLDPMEDENCLLKTKDWWTYEFCYGSEIRQYHMEGKFCLWNKNLI